MKQLLEAGVHFGHQTRRWNPKMAPGTSTQSVMVSTSSTCRNLVGMVDDVNHTL